MKTTYGLLYYSTENIGDEIQSIAVKRFLPKIDYYFDRDNIDATKIKKGDQVKIILNGWYTHKPENWPPKNPALNPLLISMHVEQNSNKSSLYFKKPTSKQFLNKFGPVGARNSSSLDYFKDNGIDAYLSRCMTLTILPDSSVQKCNYILAVDVSDKVYNAMRARTKREIIRMDTYRMEKLTIEEKEALAKLFLYYYQSAHCVVTERLHCMLPCLALNTSVLAISGRDFKRYSGLIELTRNVTEKEFIQDKNCFDLDNPPKNPSLYKSAKEQLEQRCKAYTNFDSENSYLENQTVIDFFNSSALASAISKTVIASRDRDVFETELKSKNQEILLTLNQKHQLQQEISRQESLIKNLQEKLELSQQQLNTKDSQIKELTHPGVKTSLTYVKQSSKQYIKKHLKKH